MNFVLDDQKFIFKTWDTSGQERFRSLIPTYIRNSRAAIIVYDITSRESFLNLKKWLKLVLDESSETRKVIIIGNKNDLESQRQVSYEEGRKFAMENNAFFFETGRNSNNFYNKLYEIFYSNESKTFSISASGLKNIFSKSELISSFEFNGKEPELKDDEFCFIIGNFCVVTNRFFAEFISPRVSHLHRSDITVNSICLNDFNHQTEINLNEVFNFELIEIFKQITIGQQIKIDCNMSLRLYYLGNLLENDEISQAMKDFSNSELEKLTVDDCILLLENKSELFNANDLASIIAKMFYSIDQEKLVNLPKQILYLILSNENLKLNSEDSLLDFINKIFSDDTDNKDGCYNKTAFYELVVFTSLSNEKIKEFVTEFDPHEITCNLWENLAKCFNYLSIAERIDFSSKRYFKDNNT